MIVNLFSISSCWKGMGWLLMFFVFFPDLSFPTDSEIDEIDRTAKLYQRSRSSLLSRPLLFLIHQAIPEREARTDCNGSFCSADSQPHA